MPGTLQSTQTVPFGPNAPADHAGMLTKVTFPWMIASADKLMSDLFNAGICRRIYMNVSGTIYVQRTGDVGFTPYTVLAGQYLDGEFVAVGGTGTGSTAMTVNLEL